MARRHADFPPASSLRTFRIACWSLGTVAFVQVMASGVALAKRFEQSRVVKYVDREVPKIVTIQTPVHGSAAPETPGRISAVPPQVHPLHRTTPEEPPVATLPDVTIPAPPSQVPQATPLGAPPVSDPALAKLLDEARAARVAGDMGKAITKLDEAQRLAAQDPNVLYELGMVYESMGVFDRASDAYQKLFQLGTTGAGAYYELAGRKLRDGFERPDDKRGRLALGRPRVFRDTRVEDGERVVLTVPLQAAPGEQISSDDLEVVVRFYDETRKGDFEVASPMSQTTYDWATLPVDWKTGEELLRVSYYIPKGDAAQDQLFGGRKYYGQVVELYYNGVLLDSQAWPRHLAGKVNAPARDPLMVDPNTLPPNFNPDTDPGVLPPLPQK